MGYLRVRLMELQADTRRQNHVKLASAPTFLFERPDPSLHRPVLAVQRLEIVRADCSFEVILVCHRVGWLDRF